MIFEIMVVGRIIGEKTKPVDLFLVNKRMRLLCWSSKFMLGTKFSKD